MALVKISANLAEEVVEEMKALAEKRGITLTELLRQALATEKFLTEEMEQGSHLILEREGEQRRELVRL